MGFRFLMAGTALAAAAALPAQQFEAPFRIHADDNPIQVDVGHAHPYVVDFDGDGVRDLLVGQMGLGRLRVYKNLGTNAAPKFGAFEWFHAGGEIAKVDAG
jgi:hypothetical protein